MKSEIRFDLSKLNAFAKSLDDKHQVQVGIFGNKNNRKDETTGKTNAEIGAIHEFGSFSLNIPMRSFLRMPVNLRADQILKDTAIGADALLAAGKIVMVLKRLGIACENAIQLAFATRGFGQWAPDRVATVERKTSRLTARARRKIGGWSNSPLIDTGQLRRSIDSRVVGI